MNRLPKWFRTAFLVIAMAGAVTGGMAGSADARPKQCLVFAKWLTRDYEQLNYWAELANSAYADGAWDEYRYYLKQYGYWAGRTANEGAAAKESGCAS
jgi:hypothetical protein